MEKSPNESEMNAKPAEIDARLAEIIKFPMPFEVKVEDLVRLKHPLSNQKIKSEHELENSTCYMRNSFDNLAGPNLDKVKKIFKNQTVVDLGAGESSLGYQLSVKAGAKSYIGVEPYFAQELRHGGGVGTLTYILTHDLPDTGELSFNMSSHINTKEDSLIPWSVVDTDMLSFLKSVEDGQISVLLSGIDDIIIKDDNYADEVGQEIERTLAPQGGVLSIHSYIYSPSIDREGEVFRDDEHEKERTFYSNSSGVKIYTK